MYDDLEFHIIENSLLEVVKKYRPLNDMYITMEHLEALREGKRLIMYDGEYYNCISVGE